MSPSICYFNGEYRSIDSIGIPISDIGFINGATVTEQLRTFNGVPFLLTEHLKRFETGIRLLEVSIPESISEIKSIVEHVASRFLESCGADECAIGFFATPGSTTRFGVVDHRPSVCVYAYPLPVPDEQFARQGFSLMISSFQEVDEQSWPKNIKVRSRVHYYLADLEATRCGKIAILADRNGFLGDTSTAAPLFFFDDDQITIPPPSQILDSISLNYVIQLAAENGIPVKRRPVHRSEISDLKAMQLANSLFCLAPVSEIEGVNLTTDSALPRALVEAWQAKVGKGDKKNNPEK